MNSNRDESSNKFRLTLKRAPAPEMNQVIALEKWRALFFKLGLVGEYQNEKIGYGNLSSRVEKLSFIITGSQTGHLPHLQPHHYTRVIDCDLRKGLVTAQGLIPPSNESLTHFGIYSAKKDIQYIFHVHHKDLWNDLRKESHEVIDLPHGSVEMAEVFSKYLKNKSSGLILLGGDAGIVSFGLTAEETGKMILDNYRKKTIRQ